MYCSNPVIIDLGDWSTFSNNKQACKFPLNHTLVADLSEQESWVKDFPIHRFMMTGILLGFKRTFRPVLAFMELTGCNQVCRTWIWIWYQTSYLKWSLMISVFATKYHENVLLCFSDRLTWKEKKSMKLLWKKREFWHCHSLIVVSFPHFTLTRRGAGRGGRVRSSK